MRVLLRIAMVLALGLAVSGWFLAAPRAGQDFLLDRLVAAAVNRAPAPDVDGLRVFMCGHRDWHACPHDLLAG